MNKERIPLAVFTALVYGFLVFPLVIIIFAGFSSDNYLRFPPSGFSMKWMLNIFTVEMFIRTFIISIQLAVGATFIALLIGLPAAYVMSRYRFKGRQFMLNFFLSPILVPGIVMGLSLMNVLIAIMHIQIFPALLAGHVLIVLPYVIRVLTSSLLSFDYAIEEAAVSLGASRFKTFFSIVLPNVTSGMIAAFILAFINSFNNVPISIFLTGPGISTLPIQMMSYVEYYFDPTVAALSFILMIMTAALMVIVEKTLGLSYFAK